MNVKRYLRAFGVMAALAAIVPASSPADISLDVSPAKYEKPIAAGKSETFAVLVKNPTASPMHILTSLSDFELGVSGNYTFGPPGTAKYSMGKWMTVNPREFDLAPNTSTQVRVSIDVPATAIGEYSSIIFFATRPTRHAGGMSISERVASKIYEMVPDTVKISAQVDSISEKQLADGPHYLIGMRNTGNAHVYMSGRVEVKQGEKLVDRITLPSAMLVERSGKRVIDAYGKKLAPGEYSAVAMVDYGGPTLVAGKTTFTVR